MKRRGASLVELLVASLVVGVAVAALMGTWSTALRQLDLTTSRSMAQHLARTELESLRSRGLDQLPLGNLTTLAGQDAGVLILTPQYFDALGNRLTAGSAIDRRRFELRTQMTDTRVARDHAGGYALSTLSTRQAVVSVQVLPNGPTVTLGSTFIRGGL